MLYYTCKKKGNISYLAYHDKSISTKKKGYSIFMNSFLKTSFIATAFLIMGTMQAFATNVNIANPTMQFTQVPNENAKDHTYIEKSKAIRAEINALTAQIKELRDYNSSVNNKLKALNEQYKFNKSIMPNDVMKQIKELRRSIKTVDMPEKTITEDDSIKSLVQNKEYDKALAKLNETLENKKMQLKTLQERNAIWRQIDALIG